jgi:hypothetical protein
MDTDEKNKFSSIINEFDPDLRREKDKYDIAKEDKSYQRSHHHPLGTLHSHPSKVKEHDPFNTKLNEDFDRHNKKLNTFTDMDRRDINIEESPTNKEIHRQHEHGRHQRHDVHTEPINIFNMDNDANKKVLHPEYKKEKIHEKINQFPEMSNYNAHR